MSRIDYFKDAPDSANFWAIDEDWCAFWYEAHPQPSVGQWEIEDFETSVTPAPDFGFSGDWKESLKKRDEVKS